MNIDGDTRSFDEHGAIDNMERLEPHFSNAMVELTERKAFSKSEIAVLLAERDVVIEELRDVIAILNRDRSVWRDKLRRVKQ